MNEISVAKWRLISAGVAFVVLVVATIAVVRGRDRTADPRPRRVLSVMFAALVGLVATVIAFVDAHDWWRWVLALLPGAFVIHHGVHLAVFKNRRFFETATAPDYSAIDAKFVPLIKAMESQEKRYYSTPSLLLRFAMPAVVLGIACLTVGYCLTPPPKWIAEISDRGFIHGAQLGAIGAYIYLVLFLGGRASRCDLTPGSVLWSIATIVAGPVLAGSLQMLFIGTPDAQWTSSLLPFAAGFSLRFIVEFVDLNIRRVFNSGSEAASRRIPLARLRGISREIEERFAEEGITDVTMLARANPHRLRRNMALDKRQITSWMDEAILVVSLPSAWEALLLDGVVGATHLVWYLEQRTETGAIPATIGALAARNKVDEAMLFETIQRLSIDPQIKLLRALHDYDESEASDDESLFRNFRADREEQSAPPASTIVAVPENVGEATDSTAGGRPTTDLEAQRIGRYRGNHDLFVTHSWRRSTRAGQKADVVVRLVEHRAGPLAAGQVKRVEYQLGPKFSATPIEKSDARDGFPLALCIYGPVLCLARVTFTDDREPIVLERYVDFDLPEVAAAAKPEAA